jgi:hypothetical protein
VAPPSAFSRTRCNWRWEGITIRILYIYIYIYIARRINKIDMCSATEYVTQNIWNLKINSLNSCHRSILLPYFVYTQFARYSDGYTDRLTGLIRIYGYWIHKIWIPLMQTLGSVTAECFLTDWITTNYWRNGDHSLLVSLPLHDYVNALIKTSVQNCLIL